MNEKTVISVRGLTVELHGAQGIVYAVSDLSYNLMAGEILAVVGESGSGKSISSLALLGLLPRPAARVVGGSVFLNGRDITEMSEADLRRVRGQSIAMIFQDPMTCLNPVMTIGAQIAEMILNHQRIGRREAHEKAVSLLASVGVPDPASRTRQYPHEFSGGMRQRAMIAIAMANAPQVLVADEPTTALDVTIQAQVLRILRAAQREVEAATLLITHDLGVVAEMADRVMVMYGGRAVEYGTVSEIFHAPRHPYTRALLASRPRIDRPDQPFVPIEGAPAALFSPPRNCSFHPRCTVRAGRPVCIEAVPALRSIEAEHRSACHFAEELA